MEQPEIRFLGDLQRLRPEPGDVFVMHYGGMLTREQGEAIRRLWKEAMGDAKLLVLERGITLGCIAKPDA